ncbi:MAG TPA: DUF2752 domain-containing protein [Verrucomicrobiae bacterium]|jgi:hypothetical protein
MTHAESQAVPPKIKTVVPATPLAFFAFAVSAFVIVCGLAFLYFFNPSTHGFYPRCLFHQVTGLNCPGCGATRALYALLHGQFQTALRDNALFVVSLAGGAIWGARFLLQKRKNPGLKLNLSPNFAWAYVAVLVLFGVLRNLPPFSFLSP